MNERDRGSRERRAEIMTMDEVRERSREIFAARDIRSGAYRSDLDALADMLLEHPDLSEAHDEGEPAHDDPTP